MTLWIPYSVKALVYYRKEGEESSFDRVGHFYLRLTFYSNKTCVYQGYFNPPFNMFIKEIRVRTPRVSRTVIENVSVSVGDKVKVKAKFDLYEVAVDKRW